MDWERIIMDSVTVVLVAAAISTVGGFIGVVVKELFFSSKTHDLLKSHTSASQNQQLSRKDEHAELSKEHIQLMSKGDLLNQNMDGVRALVGGVAARTNEIHNVILEDKAKQKERYKALSEKQKDIRSGIQNLTDLSAEMEELNLKNAGLKAQNTKLQTECDRLNAQVQALAKDNREWDKRYDALIDDANKQIARRDDELERLKNPHRNRDIDMDR